MDRTTLDQAALDRLVDRVFADFATAMTLPLVRLGDRLGLYRALRDQGPCAPAELAARCGVPEPIVGDWLANQAAAGYVSVEPDGERFALTVEQAAVFADEDSGVCLLGGFQLAASHTRREPGLSEAIRASQPPAGGLDDEELFEGAERLCSQAYTTSLVAEWIPALDGVGDRLRRGAAAADVGCGRGLSTVLMAQAFPASTFLGIDQHAPSIERARRRAAKAGIADRIRFDVRTALELNGSFDFVAVVNALHRMGQPERVATRLRRCLEPTGVSLIVEPFAGDRLTDNLNPLGRAWYAASTLAGTRSGPGRSTTRPLGAQAGPARLIATLEAGGFRRVRLAATTPFHLVLEARP